MSERTYGGVPGAFPYAVRETDSWFFRSYAVVGGLATVAVVLAFAISLIQLLGSTAGAGGGTLTFSRAFLVFVGFCTVAPLVAPVLLVARRHRQSGSGRRFDAVMALLGYGFLLSLYVALIASAPPGTREPATGTFAPIVSALYAAPPLAGLVPPVAVAVLTWLVARRWPAPERRAGGWHPRDDGAVAGVDPA